MIGVKHDIAEWHMVVRPNQFAFATGFSWKKLTGSFKNNSFLNWLDWLGMNKEKSLLVRRV